MVGNLDNLDEDSATLWQSVDSGTPEPTIATKHRFARLFVLQFVCSGCPRIPFHQQTVLFGFPSISFVPPVVVTGCSRIDSFGLEFGIRRPRVRPLAAHLPLEPAIRRDAPRHFGTGARVRIRGNCFGAQRKGISHVFRDDP